MRAMGERSVVGRARSRGARPGSPIEEFEQVLNPTTGWHTAAIRSSSTQPWEARRPPSRGG
jgi:hypothetical protein